MRGVAAVLCVSAMVLLAACNQEETAEPGGSPAARHLLELTFDDLDSPSNSGSADVSVDVVALGDGRLRAAQGPEGEPAARFPQFEQGAKGDPVAVVVRPARGDDPLSPGDRAFRFGADVRLDRESQGSAVDDGNNVVQRGLFDGPQYKIQVDRSVVSCRVAGAGGAVFVKEEQPIRPQEWYRIECSRDGGELTLRTTTLEGEAAASVTVERGPIGAVTFKGDPPPPLAVGCKVDGKGRPVAGSTDQFNGVVDNVFFDVTG